MKKILGYLALTIFGTFLLLFAVLNYEPPAFIAYTFGLINGLCWAGIILMWWLRQDAEDDLDEESDHVRDK